MGIANVLASGLEKRGVKAGDVVATILPNIPAQVEAHFGIPALGAVINTINTRLDVKTVAYIFDHGEAKIVIVDSQFLSLAEEAKKICENSGPEIIEVQDLTSGFIKTGKYLDDLPTIDWDMFNVKKYISKSRGKAPGIEKNVITELNSVSAS